MKKAIIDTVKGKMEWYENDAPKTVQNFIDLSEKVLRWSYFHRVIPDLLYREDQDRCRWSWVFYRL